MSSEKMFIGKLLKDKVVIEDLSAIRQFWEKSEYGKPSNMGLVLEPVEATFLLERGKIRILDENGREYDFASLVQYFSSIDKKFWIRYLIYSDLRKRGFIVKSGFSHDVEFIIKSRGKEIAEYIVYGITEGERIGFDVLSKLLDRAVRLRKNLIIAIVDKEGNISYYTLSKL